MSDEQVWVIQSADLQVGTILSFDLTDASGQVLHKAGTPISDRLKARLQKNNIHSLTIRGATHFGNEQSESLLIHSFPAGRIESIQESLQASQSALLNLFASCQKSDEVNISEVKLTVDQFVDQATKDVSAALATIAIPTKDGKNSELTERIANRSAKFSLLSVITSVVHGDTIAQSSEIGLAGLLHDCSLLLHPDWFSNDPNDRGLSFLQDYQRHPIESVELLRATAGLADGVITMISQVHEQADGTGYPGHLSLDQTHSGASILNLADAYLTLVEPLLGVKHIPTDAIAYLCYHTAQGKFSTTILQSMLQGMSIYPVGSAVTLDDDSKAMVVSATSGNPLEPVIRLFEPGNLKIDLAESSRRITSPSVDSKSMGQERVPKSRMHEILWRTDR